MIRIVQITDLHINAKDEEPRNGVDTRANIIRLFECLKGISFDLLVMSGDVCLDVAQKSIYSWLDVQLSGVLDLAKFRVVAGNHDNTKWLHEKFGQEVKLQDGELYYHEKLSEHSFIYLDTSKGYSSTRQKDWLSKEIAGINAKRVVVYMHHPPVLSGIRFMDLNHSLEDMQDFQDIFTSHNDKSFHIFCGHCHNERTIVQDNMLVYITPSCYIQIDPEPETFAIEHLNIGYRLIDINDSGKVITSVRYLGSDF